MNLDLFESLVLVFHVIAALGIIGLVLIQHGKGADIWGLVLAAALLIRCLAAAVQATF